MTDHTIPSAESLLAAALDCHARGWCVIPMAVTFDGDGVNGEKKPARKWKPYQTRRATEATIRRWFADRRVNGIAVVFGAVSGGLASRDFDQLDAYQAWADRYPHLAATLPTVATARGRHVYAVAAPGSVEAVRAERGKANGTGAIALGDGELRAGVGCYSLLPPSVHPSGIAYTWLMPPGESIPLIDLRESGFLPSAKSVGSPTPKHTPHPSTPHPTPKHNTITCVVSDCGIEAAIEASLPAKIGERHDRLFELARRLKAIPELAGATAAELLPHVRRWHARALPIIGTKEWDATWLDFLGAWAGAKHPAEREPLARVLARADAAEPPVEALAFERPALRRLVALSRELQRGAADKPFPLACRAPAELLDVDHDTVAEWLRALCAAGILRRVSLGDFTRHRAAEYRYLGRL